MTNRHGIGPLSKQLTIVIGLTVVGFMAFGLALSFYRNILFERTLADLAESNQRIADRNEQGYRDIEYFRSVQFKDKFAKENLGKMNPGEKVLLILEEEDDVLVPDDTAAKQERREAAYYELLRQMPVSEHWRLYLFHPERIEELKAAL